MYNESDFLCVEILKNNNSNVMNNFLMMIFLFYVFLHSVFLSDCSPGSNHYGIAGYYALNAVKQGMIVC